MLKNIFQTSSFGCKNSHYFMLYALCWCLLHGLVVWYTVDTMVFFAMIPQFIVANRAFGHKIHIWSHFSCCVRMRHDLALGIFSIWSRRYTFCLDTSACLLTDFCLILRNLLLPYPFLGFDGKSPLCQTFWWIGCQPCLIIFCIGLPLVFLRWLVVR